MPGPHYSRSPVTGGVTELRKKNFAFGTKVVIQRTGQVDGTVGTIVGVASRHIIDCYIVDLGRVLALGGDPEKFSAVVMPESCLDLA